MDCHVWIAVKVARSAHWRALIDLCCVTEETISLSGDPGSTGQVVMSSFTDETINYSMKHAHSQCAPEQDETPQVNM